MNSLRTGGKSFRAQCDVAIKLCSPKKKKKKIHRTSSKAQKRKKVEDMSKQGNHVSFYKRGCSS